MEVYINTGVKGLVILNPTHISLPSNNAHNRTEFHPRSTSSPRPSHPQRCKYINIGRGKHQHSINIPLIMLMSLFLSQPLFPPAILYSASELLPTPLLQHFFFVMVRACLNSKGPLSKPLMLLVAVSKNLQETKISSYLSMTSIFKEKKVISHCISRKLSVCFGKVPVCISLINRSQGK